MYHIRRSDNHDERSIHVENEVGLRYAVAEASLRAKHTGIDHQIVDDNGAILFVISDVMHELPHEVLPIIRKRQTPVHFFLCSAIAVALIILRLMGA